MKIEEQRKAFWKLAKKENPLLVDEAETGSQFHKDMLDYMFMGWVAAIKQDGFVMVPIEPTVDQWGGLARHLGRYMQMHHRYCPKTLKKYFDRFIGEIPYCLRKEVGNWESDHAFATADLHVFIYKAMI